MSSSSSVGGTMDSMDESDDSSTQDALVPSLEPLCAKMDIKTTMKHLNCYIEELHEEERRLLTDISELQSTKKEQESNKRQQTETGNSNSVEIVQVNVNEVSEKTFAVSITCKKKNGSMVSVCKALESLNLHQIKFNISSLSQSILFTLFVQSEQTICDLKETIETAISQIDS
ncbi:hypothetical protein LUZ60_001632 [Juncus effusus]|nr:hypothetical protein LUZ60_001632 [Juncus effusus]